MNYFKCIKTYCKPVYFIISVFIHAALPKFHTHPVSMSVNEGGVARFQCQINGIPEATITWEKDKEPLNTSDSR